MRQARVLLVADDEPYVRTLAALLGTHQDVAVVGTSMSGRAAIDDYARLRPDVVVMDAYMSEMDGIEATSAIVAQPGARVIMLVAHDPTNLKNGAFENGTTSFVSKQNAELDLPARIRVMAGDLNVSQEAPQGGLGRGLSELIPSTAPESQDVSKEGLGRGLSALIPSTAQVDTVEPRGREPVGPWEAGEVDAQDALTTGPADMHFTVIVTVPTGGS